jgi:hypothetical protein
LRVNVSFAQFGPQVPESGEAPANGPKSWLSPWPSSAAAAIGINARAAATADTSSKRFI